MKDIILTQPPDASCPVCHEPILVATAIQTFAGRFICPRCRAKVASRRAEIGINKVKVITGFVVACIATAIFQFPSGMVLVFGGAMVIGNIAIDYYFRKQYSDQKWLLIAYGISSQANTQDVGLRYSDHDNQMYSAPVAILLVSVLLLFGLLLLALTCSEIISGQASTCGRVTHICTPIPYDKQPLVFLAKVAFQGGMSLALIWYAVRRIIAGFKR